MNKITIQKLEHAALLIEGNGHRIAIDPGAMTGPASRAKLRGVEGVLLTHKHADHFDVAVLLEIGAPVYGPPEVAALAAMAGLKGLSLEPGVPITISGIRVIPGLANHGPSVTQRIENYGYVLEVGDARIYFTGDMAGTQGALPPGLFSLVAIPVEGGGFVFDGNEAAEFLRCLGHTGLAIAIHADEAPGMREQFMNAAKSFCKPILLDLGGTVKLQDTCHDL
jgi:L-ascorbate metabolism protein UlaG (beta-lactamase superfamily)